MISLYLMILMYHRVFVHVPLREVSFRTTAVPNHGTCGLLRTAQQGWDDPTKKQMVVSINRGTPESFILVGFSIIMIEKKIWFPQWDIPIAGWFIRENPTHMDDDRGYL